MSNVPPGMYASGRIKITITDARGKVIEERVEEMHSYVSNFTTILALLLEGASHGTVTDTSGNAQDINLGTAGFMNAMAPSGNDNYGILIGTGTNAVSVSDNNLQSKISNSTMSYGDTSETSSTSGNTLVISITRSFTNQSGSTVNVSEVGLAINAKEATTGNNVYVLLTRDVLSSAASVPANGTLNVELDLVYNPSS